jgi:WD40 repeat protein
LVSGASADGTVRVWDVASGEKLASMMGNGAAWSPDSARLAIGSGEGTVWIRDAANGQSLDRLDGHTDLVWYVGWSSEGTLLASCSLDSAVWGWHLP